LKASRKQVRPLLLQTANVFAAALFREQKGSATGYFAQPLRLSGDND